ncbi:MAG: hypothetical protein MUF21_10410 [Gemmatimonadaceae bacterium]|nr:hypothetical protein [Gemmatimonadaceae bacterium]
MYRHCIHCHADLGDNEVIERLPIGRRIAFDGARGRLWVVCMRCARWNLVPFESRWEALEACERAFRDTPLRRSTDNIGLARLREGLELVRIGAPIRPEFAAWRYARAYAMRHLRGEVLRWAGVATGVAAGIGMLATGSAWVFGWNALVATARGAERDGEAPPDARPWDAWRHAATLRDPDSGVFVRLSRRDMLEARYFLDRDDVVRVTLEGTRRGRDGGPVRNPLRLTGDHATAALRRALPVVNGSTGSQTTLGAALTICEAYRDARTLMQRLADRRPSKRAAVRPIVDRWSPLASDDDEDAAPPDPTRLTTLSAPRRLALEIALHEGDEQRWLDGELLALEETWREAEEVAVIADRLLLPDAVVQAVARMRAGMNTGDAPRTPR